MAQPPTTADGGSSTDRKNAARGFRVDCTECDDLDGSTRYELFAERDLVAERHEHDTGHDVERTPASPEALADGGVSEEDVGQTKYRGICEHCGEIEFAEHPEGEFGPECPACEAVLRIVEEHPADSEFPTAYDATDLREANEMVSMLDAEYDGADAAHRSELVLRQVGDPNA